jgi:hypothetical protein
VRPLLSSELRRFRTAAVAGAGAHLLILAIAAAFTDLFVATEEKMGIGLICYAMVGLLAGVYQVGSQRRLGTFAYLIHRPLAPRRILLALAGAASLLLAFVVGLPILLATVVGRFRPQGVDARIFLTARLVLGICLCFYLAGLFLVLSPSRARFAVLLIPIVFLCPRLSPAATFLMLALALLWLWVLASAAFKPDLSTHLRTPVAVAAFALPVQAALLPALGFVLLFVYSLGVAVSEVGLRHVPDFGWNAYFPESTFHRLEYLGPAEAMALGLRRAGGEEAGRLASAFDPRAAVELASLTRDPHRRGQLWIHDRHQTFTADGKGLVFTFSHDLMLFTARKARTGEAAGWLGPEGRAIGALPSARFESVPEVVNGRSLVTERRVYEVAEPELVVRTIFEAPGIERIVTSHFRTDGLLEAVLTDRALHLVTPRAMAVPIPGDVKNLSRAIVVPLNDVVSAGDDVGPAYYLVSFIFGTESERGGAAARQTVARVDREGRTVSVADLALGQGPPAWARHRRFLVAPLLSCLGDAVLRKPISRPPPALWLVAAVIAVTSCALTARLARRRGCTGRSRLAWSVAALLTGVPGFLTFLLLTPRAEPPP